MKIIPENNMVLCRIHTSEKIDCEDAGIKYTDERLPMYSIVEKDPRIVDFDVGDTVVCNSTGTRMTVDGVKYAMFSVENIVCKVCV